ncbi:MAG: DUF3883 domain-containing protein [Methylococcales symbiont of Iophon sp. n. MRB-2018]|nr:MAG: DUF3883 domain-containing protein [Methylococcales symbiont of Iophon sp. n. MRB-2018]KAF3979770.1 MAG: DUF3883 domain-containing protein [Methylococcales symbiont of Iophon sp. n. MRB-2018]
MTAQNSNANKHKNYEILNLIGYGLAKFNKDFVKEFGFNSKTAFYNFCVTNKIANTVGTVKNRMDLFDPFFSNNGRQGWWQKGDAYIHRKILIDSLFGAENVVEYADIVKLYMQDFFNMQDFSYKVKPIVKTKFKKMQETGLEAELFFKHNYNSIDIFKNGLLEDARLYGDGYDFQITNKQHSYLTEVKGIREKTGKFRLTKNEYQKAQDHQSDYIIAVVLNLNAIPKILTFFNPVNSLRFEKRSVFSKEVEEYHLMDAVK